MRFQVRGIDHLRVGGSSVPSKFPEQVFPNATPRPAHKSVTDRHRRIILGRAIAPATAALQLVHDAADDAAIVHPLDASAGEVRSASIAHRSAKTGSCARSQSPSKNESGSYCPSGKINEF
jgi:hypothetical protein